MSYILSKSEIATIEQEIEVLRTKVEQIEGKTPIDVILEAEHNRLLGGLVNVLSKEDIKTKYAAYKQEMINSSADIKIRVEEEHNLPFYKQTISAKERQLLGAFKTNPQFDQLTDAILLLNKNRIKLSTLLNKIVKISGYKETFYDDKDMPRELIQKVLVNLLDSKSR